MGIVDLIVIGIAVLIAFAIGAPQLLRLLFNRAKTNIDIASRNPDGVPGSVENWELKLVKDKLQSKRTDEKTRELLSELSDIVSKD